MKTLITVLALSMLMFVGCEDNDMDDDLNMNVASPGALEECPADCSKTCSEKAALGAVGSKSCGEKADLGAVGEKAEKTCPMSGASMGAVSDAPKGCCSGK